MMSVRLLSRCVHSCVTYTIKVMIFKSLNYCVDKLEPILGNFCSADFGKTQDCAGAAPSIIIRPSTLYHHLKKNQTRRHLHSQAKFVRVLYSILFLYLRVQVQSVSGTEKYRRVFINFQIDDILFRNKIFFHKLPKFCLPSQIYNSKCK